jgi:hypothetical protein
MKVIAFANKYALGFPKHAGAEPGSALELGDVLLARFDTDAHLVAYMNEVPCRLTRDLFDAEHADKVNAVDARMTAAVFDVDDPVAHGADQPARPEWWKDEKAKLARLAEAHPDPFAYRTRGGCRIVYALARPPALRRPEDLERWRAGYLSWCKYLARRFGILADQACADWTRFFRAPNVVRDGVRQRWETIGDPRRIGAWAPEIDDADRVAPKDRDGDHYGAVEAVPIADPTNAYGRARITSAVEYLRRAPLSIKGQTGRNTMFAVCTVLARRMRLPVDVAVDLVEAVYNPRLAAAGTDTWSPSSPSRHGMSIRERLEKARTTGNVPPGAVLDEATWTRLQLPPGAAPW